MQGRLRHAVVAAHHRPRLAGPQYQLPHLPRRYLHVLLVDEARLEVIAQEATPARLGRSHQYPAGLGQPVAHRDLGDAEAVPETLDERAGGTQRDVAYRMIPVIRALG